ncbi:hypothetical protein AMK23_34570 [Streptomyces sp. CB02130]|uniref:hypothetical protein n=1 Tax=Streptomyces sp. CB02130 TaxID=1703934 RepID=UPI00093C52C2|nr:hypothetical protein [Streptomyces sp. CB02130]OKJ19409.1 hypothetical protein AMK23_34570 [Streptomyces sp. CB02130]
MKAAGDRGLLHRDHPWLGRSVEDTRTQRRGMLRAIAPDGDKPTPVAWLLPVGGGMEWTTAPENLARPERITPVSPPRTRS